MSDETAFWKRMKAAWEYFDDVEVRQASEYLYDTYGIVTETFIGEHYEYIIMVGPTGNILGSAVRGI